jgi:hypothetical protein
LIILRFYRAEVGQPVVQQACARPRQPINGNRRRQTKRPAIAGLRYSLIALSIYVVERGFTAIAVAGTVVPPGLVILQPGSDPGAQAGRLGLICCVSFSVGTSMKWISLSPAVDTKNNLSSGLNAPVRGAVTAELSVSGM